MYSSIDFRYRGAYKPTINTVEKTSIYFSKLSIIAHTKWVTKNLLASETIMWLINFSITNKRERKATAADTSITFEDVLFHLLAKKKIVSISGDTR